MPQGIADVFGGGALHSCVDHAGEADAVVNGCHCPRAVVYWLPSKAHSANQRVLCLLIRHGLTSVGEEMAKVNLGAVFSRYRAASPLLNESVL